MKISFMFYATAWFLYLLKFCLGQETCSISGSCNAPFLEIPSNSPVISPEAIKTFDSVLTLTFLNLTDTEINITIFTSAAENFYSTNSTVQGFISPLIIESTSSNQIFYTLQYNYTTLNNSINGTDAIIASTIGNTTYVTEGLNMYAPFQETYNVTNSIITGGNCLCATSNPDSICVGFPDYTCTSRLDGVAVACAPASSYCFNEGYCFKDETDGTRVCSCQNTLNYWHVGERCETMFHIWMVIVFFVVVGLLLFLVIPLITLYCVRTIDKRIFKEKEKQEKKKLKAAAKDLEKMKKEKNDQAAANGATHQNGDANPKTVVPVAAPRQAPPPASQASADSFEDSTSVPSNPASIPNGSRYSYYAAAPSSQDPIQTDINPYATVKKTRNSQRQDSTSDTSTSMDSGSGGPTVHPHMPYHSPPSYANLPLPTLNRQDPMVTTV